MNLLYRVVWLCVLWGSALSDCVQNNQCNRSPVKCVDASSIKCSNLKYRTLDGSCNNPIDPALGMPMTAYQRLLPTLYEDGVYSMRLAKSGNPLPSTRLLSYATFGRQNIPDPDFTLLNMQWGQIVAHDTSNILAPNSPGLKPSEALKHMNNRKAGYFTVKQQICCGKDGNVETRVAPACFPIAIPNNDPYYKDRRCLDFIRSVTDKDQKCPGTDGPVAAQQISGVTHYMDLSLVYGNSVAQSRGLRTLNGGLLKTKNDVWPPQTNNPQAFCRRAENGETCFELGDFRGNQNAGLTILQIVFFREHNRIARELARINPHWDDETLFQEARRINIAQFQHITYYEWNVNSYGQERLRREGLIYPNRGNRYVNDYDACADPRSLKSFMQSVFRYFHSQIMGKLELINEPRTFNQTIQLLDHLNAPGILEQPCKYSQLVRGLSTQAQDLTDENFDFAAAEDFGSASIDLRSFDIQRDRDHGLPPYNDFREYCGFKRATSWNDYLDHIPAKNVAQLRSIFESHEDVDLTMGGTMELHAPNSLLGPTFLCIALKHFKNQRIGDRYFFENGNQPYPFTPYQLGEIRKSSAAKVICNNSPVENMQPNAFKKISNNNRLRPCSRIPEVNLNAWRERNFHFVVSVIKNIVQKIRQFFKRT